MRRPLTHTQLFRSSPCPPMRASSITVTVSIASIGSALARKRGKQQQQQQQQGWQKKSVFIYYWRPPEENSSKLHPAPKVKGIIMGLARGSQCLGSDKCVCASARWTNRNSWCSILRTLPNSEPWTVNCKVLCYCRTATPPSAHHPSPSAHWMIHIFFS